MIHAATNTTTHCHFILCISVAGAAAAVMNTNIKEKRFYERKI